MIHTLTLPSGAVIGSGVGEPAIRSVQLTASVGSAEPGGVQAAELDITLFGDLSVEAGDRLVLSDETGQVGVFFLRKVLSPAPGQKQLLAYDAVQKLDADADPFLDGLTFPVALGDLARSLAAYFGLELTGTLLNADYEVPQFHYRGITGRQLMGWICQAGGRFCVADGDGLRLDWFQSCDITLREGTDRFVYQDSLTLADYAVPPVSQVVIRDSAADVGTAAGEGAALYITGNPLLCGDNTQAAQTLLDALSGFSYTPCTLSTNAPLLPGQLYSLNGCTCAAVTVTRKDGRYQVTAPGEAVRGTNPTGVTQRLAGRVLELDLGLQQVQSRMAEFALDAAKVSQLTQNVDHITAQVAVLKTGEEAMGRTLEELQNTARQSFAQMSLRSDALELTVGALEQGLQDKADAAEVNALTEHFRFDGEGLTITDSQSGMGITVSEEAVVFTGGQPTTRITPTGLVTTEASVEDRLRMGNFTFLPRTGGNLSLRWIQNN